MPFLYILERDRAAFFSADRTCTPRLADFAYANVGGVERLIQDAEVKSINPYGEYFTLGRIKKYGELEAVRIKRTFGEPNGIFITPAQPRTVRSNASLEEGEQVANPLAPMDTIIYAFEIYHGITVNKHQNDKPLLLYRL